MLSGKWLPVKKHIVFSNEYCLQIYVFHFDSPFTEICLYTLGPRQNGRHFADAILKCILVNENVWIPIKISLKFVPKGAINNIPALVQIMTWRGAGDKPLSEPMMVSLPMHICVTRPQWVKIWGKSGQCYTCWFPTLLYLQGNIRYYTGTGKLPSPWF